MAPKSDIDSAKPRLRHTPAPFASNDSQKYCHRKGRPMGTKRNAILGLLTIFAFVGTGLLATAQDSNAQIDYDGFTALTQKVAPIREARLIDLDSFNEMKAETGTILLDTRSADAFAEGHIDGAVNLNFSDFTDEKLAKVIGDKTTRILIYCNNNFTDNVSPIMKKRVELALNVPTFINLYGYGYENIYELGGAYSINDAAVNWVSDWPLATVQEN